MSIAGFEYAQARLQARHGDRPDRAAWRRLHASASVEHFLDACARTGLARWVVDVHADQDARQIERALAAAFDRYVGEVASWLPPRWQPAVRGQPSGRREADVDEWRALWPRTSRAERAQLEAFVALLDAHRERMQSADAGDEGWRLRDRLEGELTHLFRREPRQPVTPLSHLALVALDLEKLRGAVLCRVLFPDLVSEASWV